MKAEILSVGTELLLGTITDTNAPYLAQRLASLGIDCFYISQIGDNLNRLAEAFERAWQRSDLVVTTGGLGPTQDDLTREAIALMLGETPTLDPDLEAQLRQFFKRRGYDMPQRNLKQATVIPSARPINNPVGTAPGWWVENRRDGTKKLIVSMPGVPFEMTRMWEHEVEPRLRELSGMVIASRTLKVLGMGESNVEEKVENLMLGQNPTLAPYAKRDGVHLRITAKARDLASAHDMISAMEAQVRDRLGLAIYGVDEDTPVGVVQSLLALNNLTYALLEIGEGATGSIIPQLASGDLCRGTLSLADLQLASQFLTQDENRPVEPTLEAACGALQRKSGADIVLAVRALSQESNDNSVLAEAEIALLTCTEGNVQVSSTWQKWRTASSEISRFAGLSALNMLRLSLLEREAQ